MDEKIDLIINFQNNKKLVVNTISRPTDTVFVFAPSLLAQLTEAGGAVPDRRELVGGDDVTTDAAASLVPIGIVNGRRWGSVTIVNNNQCSWVSWNNRSIKNNNNIETPRRLKSHSCLPIGMKKIGWTSKPLRAFEKVAKITEK